MSDVVSRRRRALHRAAISLLFPLVVAVDVHADGEVAPDINEEDGESWCDGLPDPPADDVPRCQCDNEADRAIIDREDVEQDAVAGACAFECLGQPGMDECVTACIVAGTAPAEGEDGLSEPCAQCYTYYQILCSVEHCLPACLEPSSEDCRDCQRQRCDHRFDTCTGVTL